MVKRTAKGRAQPRSKRNTGLSNQSNKKDDIDWNISSEEASGDEMVESASSSEYSEEEDNETVEEKKLRLAKEYLEKIRLEEGENEGESGLSEESSEENTKTTSTACSKITQTSNVAKKGNGYARITLISITE